MNAAKRHEIFSRLRAANPHPTTELEYATPFELLVAVVLSAQSTDKGVNLATRRLFPAANTPATIHALGQAGLEDYIKTIGLYKSKAKHLIETCRLLIERHGGEVPAERAALEALPGVGRKTANVILNTAFGQPTMAVDTHIFRVANRIGLAPGKTVLEVEKKLMRAVPKEFLVDAHHWLILHGRYVCQARKPKCGECIIADLCEYKDKTWPTPAPESKKRSPARSAKASPRATPNAGKRRAARVQGDGSASLSPTLPPAGGGSKRRAARAQGDGSASLSPTLPPAGGGSKRRAARAQGD